MSILSYLILILLIGPFAIFTALFFVFALDTVIRGHDLPTSRRAIKTLSKIISQYKLETGNFYDLGCGRGKLVIAVKRNFPKLSVWAIDKSASRIFFARLKLMFFGKKIFFQKKDIFQTDLTNADIVYTYLWYDLMPPLEKKLQKELKRGAIVITNTSNFPNWKPEKTYITFQKDPHFEKIFVYVKN